MSLINPTGSNDKNKFIDALLSALSDFYNKESGTNLEKLYNALAEVLVTLDIDISALRHDNFLAAKVVDELVERGIGDLDRLAKEGAYKIDRIGFTSTDFVRQEIHYLEENETTVALRYIPVDYTQVKVYNSRNPHTRIPMGYIAAYSESDNTVTVGGIKKAGNYIFEYVDTGDVTSETERLQIPTDKFKLGWGQDGFGHFGIDQTRI